jgi:hypothetical protein
MKKVTISALAFAFLLAAATPAGSQSRPRRVNPVPTEVYSESGPQPRAEERAEAERPVRRSRWRRALLGVGLAAAVSGVHGGRSCTPSRGVLGRLPR